MAPQKPIEIFLVSLTELATYDISPYEITSESCEVYHVPKEEAKEWKGSFGFILCIRRKPDDGASSEVHIYIPIEKFLGPLLDRKWTQEKVQLEDGRFVFGGENPLDRDDFKEMVKTRLVETNHFGYWTTGIIPFSPFLRKHFTNLPWVKTNEPPHILPVKNPLDAKDTLLRLDSVLYAAKRIEHGTPYASDFLVLLNWLKKTIPNMTQVGRDRVNAFLQEVASGWYHTKSPLIIRDVLIRWGWPVSAGTNATERLKAWEAGNNVPNATLLRARLCFDSPTTLKKKVKMEKKVVKPKPATVSDVISDTDTQVTALKVLEPKPIEPEVEKTKVMRTIKFAEDQAISGPSNEMDTGSYTAHSSDKSILEEDYMDQDVPPQESPNYRFRPGHKSQLLESLKPTLVKDQLWLSEKVKELEPKETDSWWTRTIKSAKWVYYTNLRATSQDDWSPTDAKQRTVMSTVVSFISSPVVSLAFTVVKVMKDGMDLKKEPGRVEKLRRKFRFILAPFYLVAGTLDLMACSLFRLYHKVF